MAKINKNGKTIKDYASKKNSAKTAGSGIQNALSLLTQNMPEESKKNASTIATIISML